MIPIRRSFCYCGASILSLPPGHSTHHLRFHPRHPYSYCPSSLMDVVPIKVSARATWQRDSRRTIPSIQYTSLHQLRTNVSQRQLSQEMDTRTSFLTYRMIHLLDSYPPVRYGRIMQLDVRVLVLRRLVPYLRCGNIAHMHTWRWTRVAASLHSSATYNPDPRAPAHLVLWGLCGVNNMHGTRLWWSRTAMGRVCPRKLGKYPPDPLPGGGTP